MGMGSEKYLTAIRIQKMVTQYLTNKKNELIKTPIHYTRNISFLVLRHTTISAISNLSTFGRHGKEDARRN